MKRIALSLLLLANSAWGYDSFESEKHLYAFHAFTKEIKRFFIQFSETTDESGIISSIKFDLYKCGISSTLETCLDSELKSIKSLKTFKKEEEQGIRYLIKGITKKLYDNFNIVQIMTIHYEGDIVVDKVEFFRLNESYTKADFQSIFDLYITGSLTPVMAFDEFLTKDPSDYLIEAEVSQTPEKILHFLKFALNLDDSEEFKEKVTEVLKQKLEFIKELKNPLYQEEFLIFLEELNILSDEIALTYLASTEEIVKMKAAVVLSMREIKEPATIHPLVIKALKFHDYKVQLRALDGIFKIKETLQDDIQIMNMMMDGHSEVSEKAYHLSLALDLSNDHIPHLKALLEIENPNFMLLLLNIVNKIDTDTAKSILIDYLDDNTEEVVKTVFKHIKTKELNVGQKDAIYEHLKDIRPHTKFYVLQLIGQYKTDRATRAMISLLTDINPKVKELASVLLDKRENLERFKGDLKDLVGKKRSRLLAIKLLNRYEEADITNLFIQNLKHVKKDEREGLFGIIKSRKFTGNEFKTLTRAYRTIRADVRGHIIKLFTLIPEKRSLDFLNKVRKVERNEDVKKDIDILKKHLETTLATN
jgi:hypothetical protein